MKLSFLKKRKFLALIGILLLVLLIVIAQFSLLTPLKSDLTMKQQQLQSEQKLLDIASQKTEEAAANVADDTRELQKKIPVKPLQDQFILDLEKAETVSNSEIKSYGFSKDADVSTGTDQANTGNTTAGNTNSTQSTTASASGTDQAAANQNTSTQQAAPAVPSGMKKLTVSLSVESPSYEDFEKFIQTLESLKRIVVVETINYSGGQEITSLTEDEKPLTFSLTVSTYYMPGLADLASQVPKLDAPAPAHKDNPLSTFADTTEKAN
ncbi:type 4a pilus biogenesis protein PilO [Neobacillus cucumis]|uniref:type 4a pilus biogenesis protein PilO n=1 Tax=Neobacillus cucumis TaxID=1740721 RepID=UPI0018E04940|nr:type 4a pilus biogenesis protein PilO [Neobacillus cucumis]MBI0576508.1 type 4a pilus biogenesis protein PilO [Neobacillus cucumis]